MERRLVLFAVTAFAVMLGYQPVHRVAVSAQAAAAASCRCANEQPKPAGKSRNRRRSRRPKSRERRRKSRPAPEPEVPEQWVTLGSADENDPYRMLVTLTNRGAAVARIELSSPRLPRHRQPQRLSGPPA